MRKLRLPAVAAATALVAAAWLSVFLYRYLDDLARRRTGTLSMRFFEELTGVLTALVIVPIVVFVTRRVPWRREAWPRAALAHLAGGVTYTLAHTTLMALSRAAISPLIGMGPYDYGNMLYRYPMEARGLGTPPSVLLRRDGTDRSDADGLIAYCAAYHRLERARERPHLAVVDPRQRDRVPVRCACLALL